MYGKLFTQMYDGTLATKGPWQALVTFQQFIILADREGVVDMTAEAIARRTTLPLEVVTLGIRALEEPDPESRSPDLNGRRIVRLAEDRAWGWQIVNYRHYRMLRSQEDRREYMRKYQREYRAKKQQSVNKNVNNVSEINQSSKQYAVSSKQEVQKPGAPRSPPKAKNPTTGTRLDQGWQLPQPWREWAVAYRTDWTEERVEREALVFRDYWHSKAGADARKVDWLATFRNWIRRAA